MQPTPNPRWLWLAMSAGILAVESHTFPHQNLASRVLTTMNYNTTHIAWVEPGLGQGILCYIMKPLAQPGPNHADSGLLQQVEQQQSAHQNPLTNPRNPFHMHALKHNPYSVG